MGLSAVTAPVPQITGFSVGKVRAELVGEHWSFAFYGKSRDDTATFACTLTEAQQMAAELHTLLEDLEPLLREVERRRGDITQTLVRWQQERQEATQ